MIDKDLTDLKIGESRLTQALCHKCIEYLDDCDIARAGACCQEISVAAQRILQWVKWTPERGVIRSV